MGAPGTWCAADERLPVPAGLARAVPAEQPGCVDFSPQLKSCWEPRGSWRGRFSSSLLGSRNQMDMGGLE